MSEVREILARLGLSEYVDVFIAEGFDTWDILTDITESDLTDLNVKLGHRRKLQRTIADFKTRTKTAPHSFHSGHGPPLMNDHFDHNSANRLHPVRTQSTEASSGNRQKRKYRRHPKANPNAPERPDSAYVMFSNHIRELLKDRKLSFTDMAKVAGEKWQALPPEAREGFESQASAAKAKFNAEIAEYKKTDQYEQYQEYLGEFKARSSMSQSDGKRAKVATEASNETPDSYELADIALVGRQSAASVYSRSSQSDGTTPRHAYSQDTSPAMSHLCEPPSPIVRGGHGSLSNSPTSGARPRYPIFDLAMHTDASSAGSRHRRTKHELTSIQPYPNAYISAPRSNPRLLHQDSSSASSQSQLGHFSDGYSSSSYTLPSLSRDMLRSRHESSGSPLQAMMDPDLPRSTRVLPTPIPLKIAPPLSLEHRPLLVSPPMPARSSSLAALLRAGELASAREAESHPPFARDFA